MNFPVVSVKMESRCNTNKPLMPRLTNGLKGVMQMETVNAKSPLTGVGHVACVTLTYPVSRRL